MTPEQFEAYENRLSLTDPGKSYLRRARNGTADKPAAPSRKSRSKVGNLVVRYASGKNEKVLTCESRRVELAIALILENDDSVLEFLTQPTPIELCYVSANNRKVRCMSTPDFLVLQRDRIELVEGKLAEQMQILVKERPGRYQQTGENLWRCPPAEESARALGFDFRVWTDADFSREYICNLKHLDPFLKLGPNHFAESSWKSVRDFLLNRPGISLDALAAASGVNGPALVRWMLAHRLIYCNLDKHVPPPQAFMDLHCQYPVGSVLKLRRTELSHDEIRRALTAALETPIANAPSMRQLAKDIAVSMWMVQTHFQDLADRISERYRKGVALRKEQSAQERVRIVRETIAKMETEHCPVSVHSVVKRLREAGVKGSWAMWKIAVYELRGEKSSAPVTREVDGG